MKNTISWFPGHMKKSLDLMKKDIKEVDLIIQIVDARAIDVSANEALLREIGNNKKVLKIALKNDLAQNNSEILSGSILDKSFKTVILKEIKAIMSQKIESKKKKGFINPKIYVLVVGLPNVGKSSFINYMAQKKQLIIGNMPGVTRKRQWLSVNEWIEMLDTPGIFYKKIEEKSHLAILALIKTIKWEITPKEEIIEWAFNFYNNYYKKEWQDYFKIETNNFQDFLKTFCKSRKMVLKKDELDYEKALEVLFKDISNSKICKVNYEKNNDNE